MIDVYGALFARLYADTLRDRLQEMARPDAIEGEWWYVDEVARPVDTLCIIRQRANDAASEREQE